MEQVGVDLFDLVQISDIPDIEAVVVVEGAQDIVELVVHESDAVWVHDVRVVDVLQDMWRVLALGDVNAQVVGSWQTADAVEGPLTEDENGAVGAAYE